MKNLYQRLLLLIAGATQLELARHVRYLKIENEILRSKLLKRLAARPSCVRYVVQPSRRPKLHLCDFGLATFTHSAEPKRWRKTCDLVKAQGGRSAPRCGRDAATRRCRRRAVGREFDGIRIRCRRHESTG